MLSTDILRSGIGIFFLNLITKELLSTQPNCFIQVPEPEIKSIGSTYKDFHCLWIVYRFLISVT